VVAHLRLFLLLCSVLLSSCGSGDTTQGAALRVGLQQLPVSMDPRFATDAASERVQQFVHRGLLRLNERFYVEGDLAISWQHPSTLIWRFELDHEARFSDGMPVSAADVVATYRSVINPKTGSPLKAGFDSIAGIEAQGDHVVIMRLSRPDASLPTRLNLGILPARLAAQAQAARQITGCGPYRIESWNESALMLVRNEGQLPQSAGPERIRFVGVKDPVTRVLKLTSGELDFTENDLPAHLLPWLQQQSGLTITSRASTTFAYIGINTQDSALQHRKVRLALALALDRSRLKRALFADLPTLAESVLTPEHWAAAKLPSTPFDPLRAEALLDEAGYSRGSNGVRLQLNFRTSTDPQRLQLVTAMASMWQKIGVEVSIESLEWGGFYARIKRGDFQLYSLAWVGINDPDIYRQILHSSMWPPRGANRGRYSDPEVDAWLDAAAAADQQGAAKIYGKVQQRMHDDVVYIPLWFEPVIAVSGARISGFEPQADGNLRGLMSVQFSTAQ